VLQDYFTGSGTSMSEAITAGAAAVLVSSRSALTPATVKRLLTTSAYQSDTLEKRDGAGAGGLDLGAAVAKASSVRIVGTARSDVDLVDASYGPDPADAAAWQQFQQAWAAGDLDAVSAAWVQLSPQTRKWAANAFSLALIGANASANDEDFAAIESMAHAWATQRWNDRGWASDGWVAHAWAGNDWSAHAWTLSDWSAHAWRDSSWSAHAWTNAYWDAHAWNAQAWNAHAWTAHAWNAHAWTANDWLAFAWTARDWTAHAWAADAWQVQSFSAHAWTGDTWSAHAWNNDTWNAHAWNAHAWNAHAWTAGDWLGYSWAAHAWAAHAWTADVWASVDLTGPTQ